MLPTMLKASSFNCEKINAQEFNYPEFEVIEKEAGVNRFIMSVGLMVAIS